jgi:hypothetical protein
VDQGCTLDEECEGRGEFCNQDNAECEVQQVTLDTTEPDPGAVMPDFQDKIVPFFRGQACTVDAVQSGSPIPVRIEPCLHSCLTINSFHHHHMYDCLGSQCEAFVLAYYTVDGTGCPADVFGRFDPAQCGTDENGPVDLSMNITINDEPFQGTIKLEVPYLSNADIAAIDAAGSSKSDVATEKIYQYPPQATRQIPSTTGISMRSTDPAPPADCTGGACPCYPIEL